MQLPTALLLTALLAGSVADIGPVRAQSVPVDHAAEYAACMKLAQLRPDEAFESALAWEGVGGGDAARHCAAVALIGLGHYPEAAQRLQELAASLAAEHLDLRAEALAQAGQAWMLADNLDQAYAVLSAAVDLVPRDPELRIDRSIALAGRGSYWEAIDDLNIASELRPDRADILIYRASAYRFVEAEDLALEDVARALELDPDNIEGLLERGILRRLSGDSAGARDDWLKVTSLAAGTPAADAAQANLEKLDVKLE